MTDFDAKGFLRRIQGASRVAEVDAAFSEITAMPAAERGAAIDAVEKLCVESWQVLASAGIGQLRGVVEDIEAAKGSPRQAFMLAQLDAMLGGPEDGKVMTAAFTNIHKIKGDKSAPLTRAYIQEIAKLPAAELDTTIGQLKLVMNVDDAVKAGVSAAAPAKQPVKGPRPPRRKGGPKAV